MRGLTAMSADELYPEGKETDTHGHTYWILGIALRFLCTVCQLARMSVPSDRRPHLPCLPLCPPYPWMAVKEYLLGAATWRPLGFISTLAFGRIQGMFSLSVVQGTSELLRSCHPWESSESSAAVVSKTFRVKRGWKHFHGYLWLTVQYRGHCG